MNIGICGYRGDETIEIPANIGPFKVTHIDAEILTDNEKITSLYISSGMDNKALIVVKNCNHLKKIEVDEGVKILNILVRNCENLEELVIPENVEEIKGYYDNCSSLWNIRFPSTLKVACKYDFWETKFYEMHQNNKYYVVGDGVLLFFNGDYNEDIVIPKGVKYFCDYLFHEEDNKGRNVFIPDTLNVLSTQVGEGDVFYFGDESFDSLELDYLEEGVNGTIVAPANSYIEKYCNENGYNFRVMTAEEEKEWREKTEAATAEITYQE